MPLGVVPLTEVHTEPMLHMLDDESQNNPVCAAQDAVPHEHGAVFGVIPSVCVQAGEAMQMQYFFAFPTSPQGFAGLPGGSC